MNDAIDESPRSETLDFATRASLPWVCWILSVLLLGRFAYHVSFPMGSWMDHTLPLVISAVLTAILLAGCGVWLAKGGGRRWPIDHLVLLPFLLVFANTLIPVALDPRPFRYVSIAFCAIGAGCVVHSRRHLAFAIACCLVGWIVCTGSLWGDPTWVRLTAVLLGSFPLAVLIAEIRRANLMRLVRLNREAVENRRRAEEASRAKIRFLANTSHELRTPLTAILGYSELLESGTTPDGDVDVADVARSIRRSARHLLALVDDTLDLSRIESAGLQIEERSVSPRAVVEETVALLAIDARRKTLVLRAEVGEAVPAAVRTDPTRLRQILVNLVGNAIKFTHQGEVVVRVGVTPTERLVFEVVDTGVGIPEHLQESVFDPFRQVDASTTRKYGGTGLGLAISRRLAEVLGGRLGVESVTERGSTFRLDLPLVAGEEDGSGSPKPVADGLAGRRVLLAEDCEEIARLTCHFLQKAGADVTVVENGRQAVDAVLAGDAAFDVVLMDLQMPVLDGYTATTELRARGFAGPIVALTANALESDRALCVASGFDDYVTKPVSREQLVRLVAARSPSTESALTTTNPTR